jgi:hypothetical protein
MILSGLSLVGFHIHSITCNDKFNTITSGSAVGLRCADKSNTITLGSGVGLYKYSTILLSGFSLLSYTLYHIQTCQQLAFALLCNVKRNHYAVLEQILLER